MKRKFFNGFLLMALLVSSVSTFVSCKDYDEDMYVDLKSQLISSENTLKEALEAQKAELIDLQNKLKEDLQNAHDADIDRLQGLIDDINDRIDNLVTKEEFDGLADKVSQTETDIAQIKADLEKLKDCGCIEGDSWKEEIERLDNLIIGLDEKLDRLMEEAAIAFAQAIADNNVVLREEIATEIANVKALYTEAIEKAINGLKAEYDEKLEAQDIKIGELNKSLDYIFDELEPKVEEIEKRLNSLLENMITSIVVQASKNPVVGYLNTPLGVTSNILAVYYGTAENDFNFPSDDASHYATGEDFGLWNTNKRWKEAGVEMKQIAGKAGDMLITAKDENGNVKEGNAGTLYVTVNPNTVNFEGKTLDLVNSRDENAPATLSKLAKSDELLTFGYTRAANNGFYEAKATISEEQVANAQLNVNFADFKDEAVAMLKERSKSSVIAMGATIAQNIQNVAPAYAVKGTWTDSDEKEHSVYSNYGVAAVAVKPFSFNFAQDFQINSKLPGVGKLQSVVGKMINKIKLDLKLPNVDDVNVKFDEITTDDLDFTTLYIKLTLRWDGDDTIKVVKKGTKEIWTVYGKNGQVQKAECGDKTAPLRTDNDGNIYIDDLDIKNEQMEGGKWLLTCYYYFGDEMEGIVKDLVKEFNGAIPSDLGDLLEAVQELSKIQDSIDTAKKDVKDQINSYITKINNKLTQWINRAPAMLHLAMVGIDDNSKAGLLSQAKELPTKANGKKLTLVPTSYSLEMLAPAYKKFVAVTDVFNANGTEADINIAKNANDNGENLNTVVDSNVTCTLNGEAGYIYEVTYTAVDYAGKVAIRKYYVKF